MNRSHRTLALTATLLASSIGAHASGFTLSSPTIKPDSMLSEAQVFNGFGCTGKNISPALAWSGAPSGTKSYALTVYDPDAPTGSGWWHWVVYNMPASA
ncbi:MAG: YbhB/YbcL family Raf kinase inhibitor-like protein, partial [Caldimonas sp.]